MITRKSLIWATTALVGSLAFAGGASAQSTGTEATEVQEVVVTGTRAPRAIAGVTAETAPKTRSSINQEFIGTQASGQTILQSLNLVPGLNFVNGDPYGNSGGNIRLRGFDGNRVSVTFDGMPLNDTGNYASYTNQLLDSELIERATVNQGTADVDSPTASATGGTIAYRSSTPLDVRGLQINTAIGSFNYKRMFARVDSGEFGPWGTTAYLTASYTNYDKFKGSGELEKTQFNGKLYQDLGEGNFASIAAHWNINRNSFYNNLITKAQFENNSFLENDTACVTPVGVGGTVQDESTQSQRVLSDGSTALGSCTNYHGLRINPSNTGNIRGQFSYGLTDKIRLTIDPSFQYTIANGGGYTLFQERDDRLDQNRTNNNNATGLSAITNAQCATAAFNATGVDLNGDGDSCDNVGLYTPSNTNTHRYGLTSSLIWNITDTQRLRAAYTLDYGRHRQTGEAIRFGRDSEPSNPFAGQERWGDKDARIIGRDGSILRSRDRFSIAQLNQVAVEYVGEFFDRALTVNLGVRAPFFERQLNQYCYSQNGSSTVRCTTEAPASTLTNGNVTFASTGTTAYIPPYAATVKFDDVLPNLGAVYRFGGGNSVYASYAEGISVPRTDNLYQPVRNPTTNAIDFSAVQPETTKTYDLGYRYRSDRVIGSVAVWYTEFENRIVASQDNDINSPTFGFSVDRNVGAVKQKGVDAQIGYVLNEQWTINASASYNDSELQDNLFLGNFACTSANQVAGSTPACPTAPAAALQIPQFLQTQGKKVVETPDWTFSTRVDWDPTENFHVGLQAKYVGDRFATDVNDEVAPSYVVADLDVRYDLPNISIQGAYVQLNVTNLFDEDYLGNISQGNNGLAASVSSDPRVPLRGGQARTYSLGSPRTVQMTVGLKF